MKQERAICDSLGIDFEDLAVCEQELGRRVAARIGHWAPGEVAAIMRDCGEVLRVFAAIGQGEDARMPPTTHGKAWARVLIAVVLMTLNVVNGHWQGMKSNAAIVGAVLAHRLAVKFADIECGVTQDA